MAPSWRSNRAFTLIELVMSLSLVGMVLVALGSILSISMRAMPQAHDAASHIRATGFPASVMAEEISSATSIELIETQQIRFRLADRSGNGLPETITYSWSGTPGDPLLRKVNSDDARPLIESVHGARFDAHTTTHSQTTHYPGSAESFTRLASENSSVLGSVGALLNSQKRQIRLEQGFFQHLRSSAVPSDALYWTLESVGVRLERESTPGAIRLEVHTISGGEPSGVAIASTVVRAEDLGTEAWITISIPGTLKLARDERIGVLLMGIEGDGAIRVRTFNSNVFTNETIMKQSNTAGASWFDSGFGYVSYRLLGSYSRRAKSETVSQQIVERVSFTIEPIEAQETRLTTTVDLPGPVRLVP
ncbi:MAG: type II secretion system protein J [Phycisphaerales bacterium]